MNLVTGATGMLGTHLMLELLRRKQPVRALIRRNADRELIQKIFAFYEPDQNYFQQIEWREGDVLEVESLLDAMQGVQHVYHTAAVVSYHKSDHDHMLRTNVEGTANVVNVAMELGVQKLAHVSSIAALGKDKSQATLDEKAEWKESKDNTVYGVSKHKSEMEVWRGVQEGLPAIIFQPGFIIGPGDFTRSSPSVFLKLNEGLQFYPPGGTGFVNATDVAEIMVDLMHKPIQDESFILVSESESMKYLFQRINHHLGFNGPNKEASPLLLQLARLGEALKERLTGRKALVTRETVRNASLRVFYNNTKAQQAWGKSFAPIDEAIAKTALFFRKQYPS